MDSIRGETRLNQIKAGTGRARSLRTFDLAPGIRTSFEIIMEGSQ